MSLPHTPKLSPMCVSCLVRKQIDRYPAEATREQVLTYLRRLGDLLRELPDRTCGPEILEHINAIRYELFGETARSMDGDMSAVKRYFNDYMSRLSDTLDLPGLVSAAADPLAVALSLSMGGNYIDFGAMDKVDEQEVLTLLRKLAAHPTVGECPVYAELARDLSTARRLVFLTDNCGEIVLDKLLIQTIRTRYPHLAVTVLVRGEPVLNDATLDDARQVGLFALEGVEIMGNGDSLAGTALGRISPEARTAIESADLVLAKGQGNFETLQGCGLPVYYAFLCKCDLFATRFDVPRYTGILTSERHLHFDEED